MIFGITSELKCRWAILDKDDFQRNIFYFYIHASQMLKDNIIILLIKINIRVFLRSICIQIVMKMIFIKRNNLLNSVDWFNQSTKYNHLLTLFPLCNNFFQISAAGAEVHEFIRRCYQLEHIKDVSSIEATKTSFWSAK